jgi:CBS domain-containing protein
MRVDQAMTRTVHTTRASDTLEQAARQMWEHDCGCVPVVDENGRAIGIITDRDVCMAAYTRGVALRHVRVEEIMSRQLVSCAPDTPLQKAETLMAQHQIRRLAVLAFDQRLVGILSLGDIARAARRTGNGHDRSVGAHAIEDTLAAVCQPRVPRPSTP